MSVTTGTVGLAALLAWVLGGDWLQLVTGYTPIAPATAALITALALVMGLEQRASTSPTASRFAALLAAATVSTCALIIVARLLGIDAALLEAAFGTLTAAAGPNLRRISSPTAALILALAVARIVASRFGQVAFALSLGVTVAAAFVVQNVLLGGPFTVGAGGIPIAELTAICLLLLGASSLLSQRDGAWSGWGAPDRSHTDARDGAAERTAGARGFRALAILLGIIVTTSGIVWYTGARRRAEERSQRELLAVAATTADRVSEWHRERLDAARTVRDLGPWRAPFDRTTGEAWLIRARNDLRLSEITVYDLSGEPRLEVLPGLSVDADRGDASHVRPDARARLRVVLDSGAKDLVIDGVVETHGGARFRAWVPLRAAPEGPIVAWAELCADAEATLESMVQDPPLAARTAEIAVWAAREGEAVALHTLRRRPGPALSVRLPLDQRSDALGVRALLGFEGMSNGVDYAGVPVTAASHKVDGTPWVITAKIDRAELSLPLRQLAVRATLLSFLLVLGAFALVWALWSRRTLESATRELSLLKERDASVEGLRRSEDRYQRAMRASTDGVWDWDVATGAFYISPGWRARIGVAAEHTRTIDEAFFARLHPDDEGAVRERLAQHIATGEPYEIEARLRDDAGAWRWLWSRGEAERDAAGRVIRMAGSVTDITERREAADALRRLDRLRRMRSAASAALVRSRTEEELLRGVCDVAIHEGGYRLAWVGYRTDGDDRTLRPMAWSGDEGGDLTGGPIHWDGSARPFGAMSHVIPLVIAGTTIGAFGLASTDASPFDADEVTLLTDLAGDLAYGVSALRDRQALEVQRAELALFRSVMEQSSDAIFLLDDEDHRFVDFNATACRGLGYTADELRALRPREVVVGMDSPEALPALQRDLARDGRASRVATHRRKDGSTFPVDVSLTRIVVSGRPLVLGIARDISERVRADAERAELEERFLRAQRMESVGRLAGGVAHDFNNLLTVINANADLVRSELPKESPFLDDLTQIRRAGDRAAALTRQLLAFSRQSVMRREVLDLGTLVSGFLGMLRRVIGEDVRVEASLAAERCPVNADPGQLEQVLMNLCVNARDAMPRGGTLTLRTARVEIDQAFADRQEGMRPGPHVLVAITDTGDGMSQEVQSHIFEPFFTTKAPGKGTGLGLATVYGIVQQTGGSIRVTSQIGRGTTFEIHFPLHEGTGTDTPEAPEAAPPRGSETILIVEDDAPIRNVAHRVLERAGYVVHTAESGPVALELLTALDGRVDLVLTDLVMPGMSGLELARAVRTSHPGVRLLLTSGYATEALAGREIPDASLELLAKPYAIADLMVAVRRVLDGPP